MVNYLLNVDDKQYIKDMYVCIYVVRTLVCGIGVCHEE